MGRQIWRRRGRPNPRRRRPCQGGFCPQEARSQLTTFTVSGLRQQVSLGDRAAGQPESERGDGLERPIEYLRSRNCGSPFRRRGSASSPCRSRARVGRRQWSARSSGFRLPGERARQSAVHLELIGPARRDGPPLVHRCLRSVFHAIASPSRTVIVSRPGASSCSWMSRSTR